MPVGADVGAGLEDVEHALDRIFERGVHVEVGPPARARAGRGERLPKGGGVKDAQKGHEC